MAGYFVNLWISSDSVRIAVTRAAGLKSKATEACRRRAKAKLDVWVLAKGPGAKKRAIKVDPPGQALELRAPVGVGMEEIEAAWALLARASSASGSASASASRVSAVGRSSSRTSSGVSSKSGSGSSSASRTSPRWVSISQDSRLASSSSSREVSSTSSRLREGLSRSASRKSASAVSRARAVGVGRSWATRSRTGSLSGTSSGREGGRSRSRSRRSSGFSFGGSRARILFSEASAGSSRSSGSSRSVVGSSSRRAASRLVNKAVEDVEMSMILERLVKAEQFELKMKVKADEDDKFEFKSESGSKKQFKFNSRLKDGFVGDLKSELENCFGRVPEKVSSLIKEVERVIDDRNLKLKIGEEFGMAAMEEFAEEDLARNKEEGKKLEVFRKEREARELKTGVGARSRGFRRGFRKT